MPLCVGAGIPVWLTGELTGPSRHKISHSAPLWQHQSSAHSFAACLPPHLSPHRYAAMAAVDKAFQKPHLHPSIYP